MAIAQVNPTRMEMKKLQGRYTTARRGHKLLKDKRDELMKQFLEVVREDKALRERVEKALELYYKGFSVASASGNPKMLKEALICPKKEGSLEVTYKNMMSVTVPEFEMASSEGGRAAAEKFMHELKIFAIETHVADARSCCLHPASATHRQMNDEELIAAGVPGDLVRLSCGLEHAEDLIADLAQALESV